MSTDLTIEVIDAIANEIGSISGLPRHTEVRYRRPVAVFPEDCPLLCIWPMGKNLVLRTTEWYDASYTIGVSWQEPAVNRATQLSDDPEGAKALLHALGLIEEKLRTLGRSTTPLEAVPAVHGLYPSSVTYLPGPEMETGLVEGYVVTVQVDLVEGD